MYNSKIPYFSKIAYFSKTAYFSKIAYKRHYFQKIGYFRKISYFRKIAYFRKIGYFWDIAYFRKIGYFREIANFRENAYFREMATADAKLSSSRVIKGSRERITNYVQNANECTVLFMPNDCARIIFCRIRRGTWYRGVQYHTAPYWWQVWYTTYC
jgi:hypothetical protein